MSLLAGYYTSVELAKKSIMNGNTMRKNQSHHSARRLHLGNVHLDSNIHFTWDNKVRHSDTKVD